ncbi:hypothetical protein PDESU_03312 [Pontiella desulfatans]|uniref:Uncharacterized protein n=1 Tax=Pontiella desulfatans TaxID=2750659 RepID=A0A6C2U4D4_PONDE|nr:hypothetical protein [Pontiella desulfatans]VGO14743.1 hypothetical protein PDESU_03312 [Pontiella desulfatans]
MVDGVQFDHASERAFQRSLDNVFDQSQRSAADTVKYGAIRFATSGRASSKIGKKNRDVVPNSSKNGAKWLIVVKNQKGKPDRMLPTNALRDPRRVIKMRGAAKNSWNGVFRTLNGKTKAVAGGGRGASWGTAKKRGMDTHAPSITIENFTSYMMKAFPAILPTAYNKAANAMQAILDRKVSKEFERAWN